MRRYLAAATFAFALAIAAYCTIKSPVTEGSIRQGVKYRLVQESPEPGHFFKSADQAKDSLSKGDSNDKDGLTKDATDKDALFKGSCGVSRL